MAEFGWLLLLIQILVFGWLLLIQIQTLVFGWLLTRC